MNKNKGRNFKSTLTKTEVLYLKGYLDYLRTTSEKRVKKKTQNLQLKSKIHSIRKLKISKE